MKFGQSCVVLVFGIMLLCGLPANAQDVDFGAVYGIGGTSDELAPGLAVDLMGNVYLAGYFMGTIDVDPGAGVANLTSAGNFDAFVAKYDKFGALLWAHQLGSPDYEFLFGAKVDSAGNVYLVGAFQGTIDFDPGPGTFSVTAASAFDDAFVWKLDTDGNLIWVRTVSGASSDTGLAVALDPFGNVYSMGRFVGTVDMDPGAGVVNLTSVNFNDFYVQKLDSDGNFIWAVSLAGRIRDFGRYLDFDNSGNLYMTASFQGTVDFDPGAGTTNLVSAGANDSFIWKLDPSGNLVWAHRFGDTGEDDGLCAAVDNTGNVVLAGSFQNTVDFDPGAGTTLIASASARSLYVLRLTSAGALDWAGAFTGMDEGYVYGLEVDSANDIFLVGSFEGTADFDPSAAGAAIATSAGGEDFYITKLDASGAWEWTEQRGTTGRELGGTIVTDGAGTLYTSGIFSNTLDFDTGPGTENLTASGSYDVFLLKQVPKVGDIITSNPTPGNIFENSPLTLIAPAGHSNYVWKRNGMLLPENAPRVTGTQTQMLQYSPVLVSDEGNFTVTYDDGSKSILESQPYVLSVTALTGMPAAGLIGITALGGLLAMVGWRRLRGRSDTPV